MPRGLVLLLGSAAAVVVVGGMRAAAWLLAPVFLALVVVIVVSPVHTWLRRRGLRPWAATGVLVLVVYGVLVTFAVVVIGSLARLARELPRYTDQTRALLAGAADLAGRFGIAPGGLRESAGSVDLGRFVSAAGALLGDLTGLATSVVFLLALLMFFSTETALVEGRMRTIARTRPHIQLALTEFAGKTRRYFVVTTVFGLIIAVLDGIALAWTGIPLAVLWGLLSFVTNYIPNIGFILGVAPPALLGLLADGPKGMLLVILIYTVINFVVQSLIQPRFVGDAVGLSTVLTFVSLVFWSWVLGVLGLLLAIPATLLAMAILVNTDPRADWAAALLGAAEREPRTRPKRRKGGAADDAEDHQATPSG
ncbi:AI-2E family transporter [Actinokineospora diospyrosa]|uniref:PurR-regulated permease PerM n=1 Tax=Actinokineospora diospyrosa TaxID=103728 RepID=A0ABT1IMN8_9PSEU|nr:AI-2E family transporter [Actinokineospora diospyrosa]MCP2273923.1 putative PurR-regulated permease PerM [Actinokineospora diospyrosa]